MPLVTVTAANFKLIFRLKRRDYKIYQLCNTKQQMDCEAKLFQFMPQSWSFQFSTEKKGKNQEKPGVYCQQLNPTIQNFQKGITSSLSIRKKW